MFLEVNKCEFFTYKKVVSNQPRKILIEKAISAPDRSKGFLSFLQ
jgi:hypothetical protein